MIFSDLCCLGLQLNLKVQQNCKPLLIYTTLQLDDIGDVVSHIFDS